MRYKTTVIDGQKHCPCTVEIKDTKTQFFVTSLTTFMYCNRHLSMGCLPPFFSPPNVVPFTVLAFSALGVIWTSLQIRVSSSASLTSVILFTLPFLSNWSNFPPWLWWMCPPLPPCPSTLAGLIKENIPWLPIFPRAWQPIILPSTWLESYYA